MVDTAGAPGETPATGTSPATHRPVIRPLWASIIAAAVAGLALLVSFPPFGQWWLAPAGAGLLAVTLHGRRVRAGAGLGFIAGLVMFMPMISWTNIHVGNLPWTLLSVLEAAYVAAMGAAYAFAAPLTDRRRWLTPLLTGTLWVAQEAARSRTPFGGFPWGKLAFGQGEVPLLHWAVLGGAPLVTFMVAVTGGLLATAALTLLRPAATAADSRDADAAGRSAGTAGAEGERVRRAPAVPAKVFVPAAWVAGAVVAALAGALVPVAKPAGDPVTVAFVQGNVPRLGFDFNAQRLAVLDNHVRGTLDLAARVAAGQEKRPALVVWPENASDVDPLDSQVAAAQISRAANAIGAPILVGGVTDGSTDRTVRNIGVLWWPAGTTGGKAGADLDQLYIKRHPVPFAEYIPLRSIARMVSKEVDRVSRDFEPGDRPGVIDSGATVIGDVICFEIAYDGLVRDVVTGGAQILAVQTNNATFNTAEAEQQLAMVQLRAVEHGRDALMASTVGVSAFVGADGHVQDQTVFNTVAVVVRDMTESTELTVATRLGHWPELALTVLGLTLLAGAAVVRIRRRPVPHGAADA
ncbi:apolipoprotein N-acyltransferase [Catenuloplanes nepalensis]|uniref:Apolipoprotein N-acyltransferase n=1 Tax=Catenuloplanes nepalensis TaxID=587533 RepID=A0ABT9MT17_9ACTN|nr:apolipoprotein N-acyltransferase [Catenuloplanes nepalensis]MDP9794416.1 apolipoprotein N-acyltransferase [Catenuloplanes nepalensis]